MQRKRRRPPLPPTQLDMVQKFLRERAARLKRWQEKAKALSGGTYDAPLEGTPDSERLLVEVMRRDKALRGCKKKR
jgi:hypothetical protein